MKANYFGFMVSTISLSVGRPKWYPSFFLYICTNDFAVSRVILSAESKAVEFHADIMCSESGSICYIPKLSPYHVIGESFESRYLAF